MNAGKCPYRKQQGSGWNRQPCLFQQYPSKTNVYP